MSAQHQQSWQHLSRRTLLKTGAAVTGMTGIGAVETELAYAQEDDATVTIRRDDYGVPHIYARDADSRAPVFYGFGYATAADRLYQLELYRRYYHGTVAAVLGSGDGDTDWVQFDIEARRNTAGEPSLDEQAAEQLTADQRAVLQAFTDGINRYITEVRESEELEFHQAFQEHGFEPEEFTTTDAAGMFVASMAYFSGFQLETLSATVLDALTQETGSEQRALELFEDLQWGDDPGCPTSTVQPSDIYAPPYTDVGAGPTPNVAGGQQTDRVTRGASGPSATPSNLVTGGDYTPPSDAEGMHDGEIERMRTLASGLDSLGLPIKYGSNALAVQGDITASGDALLMGGPQMGFNTPSIMYEASLHGPDFDVAGVTVTGYPFIMFGHNRNGAMTSTAGIDNCIQMFTESITTNSSGPDTYTFRGEEYEVETAEQTITVADGEDVTYTERFTRHGVVTQWDPDNGEALAQTKSYAGRHMNCWRAFYECQFATDAEEFRESAQRCDYALNFMWADKDGDIAYVHLGRYPDSEAVDWDTRLPADGTQYELTSADYLRAADGDVPYAINPNPGYSAQWNNKPAPAWNNGDLSYSWSTDHRVQRIINLLEQRLDKEGTVDYDFLKTVIYDISFTDLRSIRYRDHLLDALADADLSNTEQQARDELASWDHFAQADGEDNEGRHSAGYTIWDATFPYILEEVFSETFGSAYGPASYFLSYDYGRGTLMRVLNPAETALATQAEYADGDITDALISAFRTAVSELAEQYDGEPATWRREAALHEFDNLALFGMPIGVTSAGNTALLNRGTENHVVRLSDDPEAENILPPGNDGYVAPDGTTGEHYDDQLAMFENSEYKQLLFADADIESATAETRTLSRPANTAGAAIGDTPTSDGTETDENTVASGPTATEETESTNTATEANTGTDASGPGFTTLTGVTAVLGTVLAWLYRQDDSTS